MSSLRPTPTPDSFEGQRYLIGQLRQRLLALDYPAFAWCVCVLLESLGYEDARPTGRREWKGYNQHGGGGYDLETVLPGGLVLHRVIVQIKQYDSLHVHQRSVDELRGACLRAGAAEALLVTTSAFSEVVRNTVAASNTASRLIAPIRLIDGEELLSMLIRHRIGVRERGLIGRRRLEIDDDFFDKIAATVKGNAQSHRRPTLSVWSVTVRIASQSRPGARNKRQAKGGG